MGKLLSGVLAAIVVCSAAMSAQTISTSQISGTVTDPTGAVIPNATIQLKRVDTGELHSLTSNSSGNYTIQDLSAGTYTLQVTSAGFSTYVQNGIVLQVGVSPAINIKLAVGVESQQVVVQGISSQVETESNGVGQVIDQQQIVDLPLNGRDPDQLIALAGGTTTAVGGDLNSNKNFPTIAISVAGGLPNAVDFVLDGGYHNEPTNGLNMPQPIPDSLQEFKVDTSALPAQYGDHASAVINAITKSGGNKFHGDAFYFIRNYIFNAQNFFANSASPTYKYKDGLKRNQFGGTIGGPIIKDKLFFFGGLQHTIVRQVPSASYTQVPTVAMLAGDFSTVTSTACNKTAIKLSAPFATVNGVPNQLPSSSFSSQALAAMKYLPVAGSTANPDATATATKGLYTAACGYVQVQIPSPQRQDNAIGRVDYNLGTKDHLFGRYFLGINNQPIAPTPTNALTENAVDQYNRDQGITLGETHIFNQNLIDALRITANRVVNLRVVQPFFDPSTLGINSYNAIPGYMSLSVTGGFSVGGGTTNPGHFNSTTLQFVNDVNYIKGNHQFAAGVDYIYALMDTVNNRPANGEYSFTGQELSSSGSYGYADFFAGAMDSYVQGLPDLENDGQSRIGLYVQDSWKANKRLTINYGVRWEPYLPEHNSNGHTENFNMANFTAGTTSKVFTSAPAGLIFDGDSQMPGNHYTNPVYDIVDLRFGLIWVPFADGKTSIRAGFGTFHDSPQMFFTTRFSNSPPFGDTISINNVSFASPWSTYPGGDPFPALNTLSATAPFPTEGVYVNMPLKIKVMDLEQWNLSVQRQVGSWLFSGSYIGNKTDHLTTSYEQDPALYIAGTSTGVAGSCGTLSGSNLPKSGAACSTTGNYNARRVLYQQNPAQGVYYSTIGTLDPEGVANYNGMLLSVQRRTKNMSLLANYTFSHCLSETETTELTGPSYVIPPAVNPSGRGLSYTNCDSDHRQVANVSMSLKSPSFTKRSMRLVASNWQLAPIFTTQTGGYSTVTTGTDNSLTGTSSSQIAYDAASPYGARSNFGVDGYLTPYAIPAGGTAQTANWASPATGTFATQRPLTIRGLPIYEMDMALSRIFPVAHTESQTVEFRWEVFNVTNEAILGGSQGNTGDGFGSGTGSGLGSTTVTSATFGDFTSAGAPRIMQFALKYNF
jgi:hypothetical protein